MLHARVPAPQPELEEESGAVEEESAPEEALPEVTHHAHATPCLVVTSSQEPVADSSDA